MEHSGDVESLGVTPLTAASTPTFWAITSGTVQMRSLTAHEESLLPTDEDIRSYHERGYWISPVVLSDEVLDDALHGVERHYAGERDAHLPLSGGYLDWSPEQREVLRLNDYVSMQNDELRDVVFQVVISAIAARLAGTTEIRLFHDQLVSKPAGQNVQEANIGWHVDAAYWQTCTSRSMLTAWVPFQDVTEEMGPITFIEGSHKWPDTEWMKTFNDRDLEKLEQSFTATGQTMKKVPVPMKRGQVSFHHCLTIHGGLPNRSATDRIALAIHLQDEANRYCRHVDENGKATLHINDLLCRKDADGSPDYSDPEVCPILWEETAPTSAS